MNRREFITTTSAAIAAAAAPALAAPATPPPWAMFDHLHPGAFIRKLREMADPSLWCVDASVGARCTTWIPGDRILKEVGLIPVSLMEPTAEQMRQKYPGVELHNVSYGRNIHTSRAHGLREVTYTTGTLHCTLRYVLRDQTLFVIRYGTDERGSSRSTIDDGSGIHEELWLAAPTVRIRGPLVDRTLDILAQTPNWRTA